MKNRRYDKNVTLPRNVYSKPKSRFHMKETRQTMFPLEVVSNVRPNMSSSILFTPKSSDAPSKVNALKPVISSVRQGYGDTKDVRRFSDVAGLKKNVDGSLIAKAVPNELVFIKRNKVYEGNGPTNVSRFYRRQALVPKHSDGYKNRSTRFDRLIKS